MAIVDSIIHPEHRGIVTRNRRRFIALYAFLGVLGACGLAAPVESEEATGSTRALPLDERDAVRVMEISSLGPQISPELPVSLSTPADAQHYTTAVAAGDGLYLVVWVEASSNNPYPDVLGVRVRASNGALLDANPLPIAVEPNVQHQPAVAFDGTNFLVVWEDQQRLPAIYGTRVRASDGVVLDTPPRLISQMPSSPAGSLPQLTPAVAFDGTNYLVAWTSYSFENGTVASGIRGIRVRASDGTRIEPYSFLISRGGSDARIAYRGGNYLVTWGRGNSVEAARIQAASGQVLDSTPLSVAAIGSRPSVAARDGEFLVVWQGGDSALWGQRLRASDGSRLDPADLFLGSAVAAPPEATFDGMDYQVTWQGTRDGVRKVLGTRVSPTAATSEELVLSELASSAVPSRGGVAAIGPGRYLTTYVQDDTATALNRARMRLVSPPQEEPAPCDSGDWSLWCDTRAR